MRTFLRALLSAVGVVPLVADLAILAFGLERVPVGTTYDEVAVNHVSLLLGSALLAHAAGIVIAVGKRRRWLVYAIAHLPLTFALALNTYLRKGGGFF